MKDEWEKAIWGLFLETLNQDDQDLVLTSSGSDI